MAKHIIIIGSGINSLCAGVVLSQAGHRVSILEKNGWIGGNIRTRAFEVAGFQHEMFSGFHPLFTTGPFYKEYRSLLEEKGLTYLNTEYTTGVLLPDGRSAILRDDREKSAAALEKIQSGEGEAYRAAMEKFDASADLVFGILGKELWSLSGAGLAAKGLWNLGPEGLLEFLGEALPNGRKWLDNTFQNDLTKALIAPWVLHTGLGPDDQASSLMLRVILASFEQTGMPVPKGGGSRLAETLADLIREKGGELRTDTTVTKILVNNDRVTGVITTDEELEADIVLANVSPTALYERLLPSEAVPEPVKQDTGNYRYGRANMQINLSLNAPPNWPDPDLLRTAMVHVHTGLNGVSRAVNEAVRGLLPAEATIVVGQHAAVDPGRVPEGKWLFWIQLQELPAYPAGDAAGEIDCHGEWTDAIAAAYADRIIDRLDGLLPGLKASILERHVLSPAELAGINPNLVGGDPYCGSASLDQFLFWRPLPALRGHETPVENLYHIGAATHPGPGLNGTSGYLVAKQIGYLPAIPALPLLYQEFSHLSVEEDISLLEPLITEFPRESDLLYALYFRTEKTYPEKAAMYRDKLLSLRFHSVRGYTY